MNTPDASPSDAPTIVRAELCIVGAGIAGMNALFAATRYLSPTDTVVLVDRRSGPGGMWRETYSYVRLHQPHAMFTAGNIAWESRCDRAHLATGTEVLAHFDTMVRVMSQRVALDERYYWSLDSATEADGVVTATITDHDGHRLIIQTPRLIKAYGFAVQSNPPLELSSTHVTSVSPDSWNPHTDDPDAPVWIIGSGKTAMDTAHLLITEQPGREVNMVTGAGTYFLSRDTLYPTGRRRWWGGTPINAAATEMALAFDGTNEREITEVFRPRYAIAPIPDAPNNMFGMLSTAESATIVGGVTTMVRDHLIDVVDRGDATELVLRSGASTPIARNSRVVNCTGYLGRRLDPYEPYLSDQGGVVTISDRSAVMHLTTYGGYFLAHLMFLDKLRDVALYEIDLADLRAKGPATVPYVLVTLAQHNLGLIADAVPFKVLGETGFDLNRWYPLPRQLAGVVGFTLTHRRRRPHLQATLDTLRDRFDVRCGPLTRHTATTA